MSTASQSKYINTNGLYLIRDDNGFGYINEEGKVIIAPRFENAFQFSEGYAVASVGDKFGYIGEDGRWKINPQFEACTDFIDGFAVVKNGRNIIIINKEGKSISNTQLRDVRISDGLFSHSHSEETESYIFSPRRSDLKIFTQNGLAVKVENKWGVINKKGTFLIEPIYDFIGDFTDNLAPVSLNNKFGYINERGEIIIQPQFDFAGDFSKNHAIVKVGVKSGIIDKKGKFIMNPIYDDIQSTFDKNIFIFRSTEKAGLLSLEKGELNISYSHISVNGKTFIVTQEGKYGLIDKKGTILITPQYDFLSQTRNNLLLAKQKDKFGYVNEKGEVIINFQFDEAGDFEQDFTYAAIGNSWGLIDLSGKFIVNPQFKFSSDVMSGTSNIRTYNNGLVQALLVFCGNTFCSPVLLSYMNKKGKLIWQYQGKDNQLTEFLSSSANEQQTVRNSDLTLADYLKSTTKVFTESSSRYFEDERLEDRLAKLLGNSDYKRFKEFDLWGLKGIEINSQYFFAYYHSCPRACGTYGIIYGDLVNNKLIVGTDQKWFKEDPNQDLPEKIKNWLYDFNNGNIE